jgi:hypothetical protein
MIIAAPIRPPTISACMYFSFICLTPCKKL